MSFAEEVAEQICEDIVYDNEQAGHDVEKHAFEDRVDQVPALVDGQEHGHNDPPEQSELILEVALLKADHEAHQQPHRQHATNRMMVRQQKIDRLVPQTKDGELSQDKDSQCIVANTDVRVPIDVLG